jgi:hypothetical protein
MIAHGHTTVWGTRTRVGHGGPEKGWYQQLRDWWMDRQARRQEEALAGLHRAWDAQHESFKPLPAAATIEMALFQGTYSTATSLYGLAR